jgi:hypothetical protein
MIMNAESKHRGIVFPETDELFPDYYILYSADEPGMSAEFLRDKKTPYYFSSWHPCHFLVNVRRFPGDMDKQLEPAGLHRVKIGNEKIWKMAKKYRDAFHTIDMEEEDGDWESLKEKEEVESDFYDLWAAGKFDEAITRVDESFIDFDGVSFITKQGSIINIHPSGLFVFSHDIKDDANAIYR